MSKIKPIIKPRRAWIMGNVITFNNPYKNKYKSPFFEIEEVVVYPFKLTPIITKKNKKI